MLCGIVLVGLEINFPEKSGDTSRFAIAVFFIAIGGWGLYQINKEKALKQRLGRV
jgi:hypothetical protein